MTLSSIALSPDHLFCLPAVLYSIVQESCPLDVSIGTATDVFPF